MYRAVLRSLTWSLRSDDHRLISVAQRRLHQVAFHHLARRSKLGVSPLLNNRDEPIQIEVVVVYAFLIRLSSFFVARRWLQSLWIRLMGDGLFLR